MIEGQNVEKNSGATPHQESGNEDLSGLSASARTILKDEALQALRHEIATGTLLSFHRDRREHTDTQYRESPVSSFHMGLHRTSMGVFPESSYHIPHISKIDRSTRDTLRAEFESLSVEFDMKTSSTPAESQFEAYRDRKRFIINMPYGPVEFEDETLTAELFHEILQKVSAINWSLKDS